MRQQQQPRGQKTMPVKEEWKTQFQRLIQRVVPDVDMSADGLDSCEGVPITMLQSNQLLERAVISRLCVFIDPHAYPKDYFCLIYSSDDPECGLCLSAKPDSLLHAVYARLYDLSADYPDHELGPGSNETENQNER